MKEEKLNLKQIIALIVMGLILICVFILRPDPYAEKDRYDQKQEQIRRQISNERRMKEYGKETEGKNHRSSNKKIKYCPGYCLWGNEENRSMDMERFITY